MDEHHVLADPSEPGELRQLALGDWPGVYIAARRRTGDELADRRRELLEPLTEDVVVIGRPRVLSYLAPRRGRGARYPGPMEIIGERHDRRFGLGHDQARIFPFFRLPLQVRHRSGVAVGE